MPCLRYLANPMLMEDWAIGQYAADPAGGFKPLGKLCGDRYDAVFCEQPWLFEFAYKRFSQKRRRALLIYGSQNVEHRLKYEIAESYLTAALAEKYSSLVEEVECFAARNSDLNIVVSDNDKQWITSVSDPQSSWPQTVSRIGVLAYGMCSGATQSRPAGSSHCTALVATHPISRDSMIFLATASAASRLMSGS